MKKSISVIGAALMLLVASVVWYSCKKEEIVVTGSIFGTVTDFATGQPVGNVNVKLRPSGTTALTGSDGSYEFKELDAGNYSLMFSKAEYADLDDDFIVKLEAGKDVRRDVQIRKKIASLQITDMNGQPLDTLDFGSEESVVIKTFNVFNDGTEVLTCSANYECEWITNVTGLENSIPSGQTVPVTVRIDRVALVDGDNTTLLYITSGNGSNEIVVKASFLGSAVITTSQATSVTASSATVGGNIADDGGRPVLARGICYGTSQTPTIDGPHTEDGSGTGTFSHNITDLSSSTTYYARAYATNRNSTYYSSNVVSFTTESGMPTVTTTDVTNVTASTAKGGGNVTNNGGFNVTARGVCWNTMGSPDISDEHTTNGNGNGVFTSNITNLALGTTYYVRAYATNQSGTSYGAEKAFTTPNGAVTITLDAAQNITANSATFTANISDDGGVPVAQRGICWATTQYPDVNSSHTDVGMGTGSYTVTIPNLQASTTYYVRAYAVNQTGTVYSAQRTFTTTNGLPTVTTAVVSNITANSAQCGGNISDNGGFNVTARGICWNTMGNPDLNGNYTINGTGNGSFSSNMTNLSTGTTYHVRAYATNSMGTSYGNEVTFSTSSGNVAMTLDTVGDLTINSATCGATITDNGGSPITARGLCWSTTQYPTLNNDHNAYGAGSGSFRGAITGLTHNTTYYVRAYATNGIGTSYSGQTSFTTPSGVLVVNAPTVSNIGENTATIRGGSLNTADCQAALTHGGRPTEVGVCYSTAHNPTTASMHVQHTVIPSDNLSSVLVNQTIPDLVPGTLYYVRSYATNAIGTFYSSEISFTTTQYNLSFTLENPTNVRGTSATFSASISGSSGATVTERGFCWSTSPNPTVNDSHEAVGNGTGSFSRTITGLSVSTTYYVRAYGIKAGAPQYSLQKTFTTTAGINFSFFSISAGEDNFSSSVTIGSELPCTEVGVCWSHNPLPTKDGDHIVLGTLAGSTTTSHNFPFVISNLAVGGGSYYIRIYAVRADGTFYSSQIEKFLLYDALPTFVYNGHTYRVGDKSSNILNWDNSNTYCGNYNRGGFTDWRMPTKDELVVMSQSNLFDRCVWSSTICGENRHYCVYADGQVACYEDGASYSGSGIYAYPVRVEN